MHGVSNTFDSLIVRYASERCHITNYRDKYNRVQEFRSAFFTEDAARAFVAILDAYDSLSSARNALLMYAALEMNLDTIYLQTVKCIDALTNGWMRYIRIYGHTPTDAQMFCAAVLAYDLAQVLNNGDVY